MTSYQIYRVNELVNIGRELEGNFISRFQISETESELAKEKINNLKKALKNPELRRSDVEGINKYNLNYNYNLRLPGEQYVWIPQEVSLYGGVSNTVLISKSQGNIRYLIEKYFQTKVQFHSFVFSPKQLITFWNSLKKYITNRGHISLLQRFILENTYLESSLLKELNIKTKDAEDIGLFNDLVKNAKKVKAITFQIKWNLTDEDNKKVKPMTVRIGIGGSVLIYGNHPDHLIQEIINAIDSII